MASHSMLQCQAPHSGDAAAYKASACEPLKARSLAALLSSSPSTAPSRTYASTSTAASTADSGDESDSDWSCSSASSMPGAFQSLTEKSSPSFRRRSDEMSTDSGEESVYVPSSTFDESGDDYSTTPWDDSASTMSLDQDDAGEVLDLGKDESCVESEDQNGGDHKDDTFAAVLDSVPELAIAGPVVVTLELCPSLFPSNVATLPEAPAEVPQPFGQQDASSHFLTQVTEADSKRIVRLTRAVLDVLDATQKVEPLYHKLARGLRTHPQLAIALGEVLDKAIWEHGMIPSCIDLCLRLRWDGQLCRIIAADGSPDSFRQTILNWSWPIFQQLCCVSPCHHAQAGGTHTHRLLGNVKLLGALIGRGVLSPRLAVEGAEALLQANALEPLAVLLQVTGPKLDGWKGWVHAARFAEVFRQIRERVASTATPMRERALLQDICVLQDSNWCSQSSTSAAVSLRHAALFGAPGLERSSGASASAAPTGPTQAFTNLARSVFLAPSIEPQAGAFHHGSRGAGGVSSLKKELRGPLSAASTSADDGEPSPVHGGSSVPCPAPRCNQEVSSPDSSPPLALPPPSLPFNAAAFRRELSALLADLRVDSNVAVAVRRVRAQSVPVEHQENMYTDILTRACEYSYKPARRTAFAFAAGLAAARPSAFDRSACLGGIRTFFRDVYGDLCEEVPKLPVVVRVEMLPTLRSVFSIGALNKLVPDDMVQA